MKMKKRYHRDLSIAVVAFALGVIVMGMAKQWEAEQYVRFPVTYEHAGR